MISPPSIEDSSENMTIFLESIFSIIDLTPSISFFLSFIIFGMMILLSMTKAISLEKT